MPGHNAYIEALLHNSFYGNLYIRELAALTFAFLFGSIPITPVFHWLFDDFDPRVARTMNALAPVVNAGKACLPVLIATHGGGTTIGLLAAVAVVAGHCYCPWRRFAGGTGAAASFGALCGICLPAAAIYLAVWLVVAIAANYATPGSLAASTMSIVSLWFFLGAPAAFAGVAMLLLAAGRYGGSYERLMHATEPTLRRPPPAALPRLVAVPPRPSVIVVDGQAIQRV